MIIISIDPGFSGGISVFDVDLNLKKFNLLKYYKMPTIKDKSKDNKPELNIKMIYEIFKNETPSLIVIEKVHAMPKMDIQSMFRFGEQIGIIKGLACSINVEVKQIEIKRWKKYFNLSKDKKESINLANKLFNINLKKTEDGIAESILIGLYYIEYYIGKGLFNGDRNN